MTEYVGDERVDDSEPAVSGSSRHRRREETAARRLRDNDRRPVEQLEAYGDYLFGAVDFLEGEGACRELVLIDFSLAGFPANGIDFSLAGFPAGETKAGTEGNLDPFIGNLTTRSTYDAHAERYARSTDHGRIPSPQRRPHQRHMAGQQLQRRAR